MILKNKQRKFVQYPIHWDKTQMLKEFSLDKINVTKNALFFLSQAPAHHSFSLVCNFYMNWSDFVSFLLKFSFLFNKKYGLFDFKTL